jgi:hypothetical protein
MAPSYRFAVIRLAPDQVRGERLNIGLVVFRDDSIDVRVTRNLDRMRAVSVALDKQVVVDLLSNLRGMDRQFRRNGGASIADRLSNIARVGPISISDAGRFVADSPAAYEARISIILQQLVEPEPAPKVVREKRTRLYSQVKKLLRSQKILAKKDEGLDSHRIVAGFELDDGLVADLVLKNGAYHIFETVDATGDESTFRKTVSEIAVSALILERARMRFGESATKAKMIYSASVSLEKLARPSLDAAAHQGAELINWASANDRSNFLVNISPLVNPYESPRAKMVTTMTQGKLFH